MSSTAIRRFPPITAIAYVGAAVSAGLIAWGATRLSRHVDDVCDQQQAAAEEEFNHLLRMWTEESGAGRARKAYDQLRRINGERLSPAQQTQWKLTAARIYHGLADAEPEDGESHTGMARWYYAQVLGDPLEADARADALQGLVDLDMRAEHWPSALGLLTQLKEIQSDSDTQRRRRLQAAECRFALGQSEEGHRELDLILAEDARDGIRARALLLQIDQRLAHLNAAFERGDPLAAEAVQAVEAAAMEALTLTTSSDPHRARALNGLLQTCVLTGNTEGAYRYVHNLQGTVLPVDERVRSYLLLSRLEEQNRDLGAAIRPLRFCLREFPDSPKSRPAFRRLYQLLVRDQQWTDALGVLEQEAGSDCDRESARSILDRLQDPDLSLLNAPAASFGRMDLGDRVDDLLDRLSDSDRPGWQDLNDDILYLAVRNAYTLARYPEAESRIDAYLNEAPLQRHLADILHLDVAIAVESSRPAVLRALRAERFLSRFPLHEQAPSAMMHLLEAYLELGLYQAVLDVGKKAFMNEIVRVGGRADPSREPQWLATVAKIAQAYARLGDRDRANQLFRACMPRHQRFHCPGSVYLDWADAAAGIGQRREALRRLQVAEEVPLEPADAAELRLARDALRLELGDPEAYRELDPRTRWAEAQETPDQSPGPEAVRKVQERWLELALSNPAPLPDESIQALVDGAEPEGWMGYWVLRAMNQQLAAGRLGGARALAPDPQVDGTAGPVFARTLLLADAAGRLQGLEEKMKALSARGLHDEPAP